MPNFCSASAIQQKWVDLRNKMNLLATEAELNSGKDHQNISTGKYDEGQLSACTRGC